MEVSKLQRVQRSIVVADVVESVRLSQRDELDFIACWREVVEHLAKEVLAAHRGRLVKSLGDGVLLTFDNVVDAAAAAACLQAYMANREPSACGALALRIGIHVAEVVEDRLDVYGDGVNLASRLAALADPGGIVASTAVRDVLVDGLDYQITDMGDCYLKHYEHSVRAYCIGTASTLAWLPQTMNLAPTVVVIPFRAGGPDAPLVTLGTAIADDVIAALSASRELSVVSRLSTAAFADREPDPQGIRHLLGAAYIVWGSCLRQGSRIMVRAELCDTRDSRVLWTARHEVRPDDLFHAQDRLVPEIVAEVSHRILQTELQRTRSLPFGSLDSYSLYLGSVALLHRLSRADFTRAGAALLHLHERYPRSAAPLAMLGKWHMLRALQGWSPNAGADVDGRAAEALAGRALELQPDHAFAHAVSALVAAHVHGDLERAEASANAAAEADPQEAHAAMVQAGLHSYRGDGLAGETAADRAIALSPLDPARFIFDAFHASASLTAGKPAEAAHWARSSIRHNCKHPASHRLLTAALAIEGRIEEAREAARRLVQLVPDFRVDDYARRYPGRNYAHAKSLIDALYAAGLR